MITQTSFSPARGWLIWGIATLFVVYQLMMQNGFGAIAGNVQTDLGLSIAGMGMLSASFLIVYNLMQLPVGLIPTAPMPLGIGPPAIACGLLVYVLRRWIHSGRARHPSVHQRRRLRIHRGRGAGRRWFRPTQFALAMASSTCPSDWGPSW